MSITFQSLAERFHLSLEDQYIVGCCINSYASSSWTLTNSFASLLNRSEWDVAKKVLADRLKRVFNEYLPCFTDGMATEKSQPLAEFFLRFLITKRNAQSGNGLDVRLCPALESLPFVEVFERASVGNGTTFPYISRIVLFCQYERELKLFSEELKNLALLLRSETPVPKKAELTRLLEATLPVYEKCASRQFRPLSGDLGEANTVETEILRSLREARATFNVSRNV